MVTDPNDWIGIYQSDFKSSTDYVTYVWAPRIPELENSQVLLLLELNANKKLVLIN